MAKERKTRNFDFLKEPQPELPSREEVIQKTVALTGQGLINDEPALYSQPSQDVPSVLPLIVEVETPKPVEEIPKPIEETPKTVEKKPISPKIIAKNAKKTVVIEPAPEKLKVGRKALEDARKPFTSTITVENKRRLRQLCAEYDIAMSDALNEILSAQFEKRQPKYTV